MSKGAIRSIEKFAAAAVRRRTERFDHCFPRGITMGDIDSHVEINHHWLFIEYKLDNQEVSRGQWLDLYRLSQRPRMSVWIIWTTEDGFITHGQVLGRHDRRRTVTEEDVSQKIRDWVATAEKAPAPKPLEYALDRFEVALYLDAREQYLRTERSKLIAEAIAALRAEIGGEL